MDVSVTLKNVVFFYFETLFYLTKLDNLFQRNLFSIAVSINRLIHAIQKQCVSCAVET